MVPVQVHKPQAPTHDVPEEFEPGTPPVEPDEGPVPAFIPDDAESERIVNPVTTQPGPADLPARHAGASIPPRGAKAPASASGMPLPHERDQSTGHVAAAPDGVMAQAKRDIDAGMVDTDMHAAPGLDAELRARLVPGPDGKPAASLN